jgi:hypothetical protein
MQFAEDLAKREAQILDAVYQGNYTAQWNEVTSEHGAHTAVFRVMGDALMIEGVRVNVTAELEQHIADLLYCSLLTPKLADLHFAQAQIVLPPMNRAFTATTAAMIDQREKLGVAIQEAGSTGIELVSTLGKHWVIDEDLKTHHGMACNYGWHFHGAACIGQAWEVCATQMKDAEEHLIRLIQGRGFRHNKGHADYSQNCVLAARNCLVDGNEMDLRAVLGSPELAPLASHQGVMTIFRQPGVDELQPVSICP